MSTVKMDAAAGTLPAGEVELGAIDDPPEAELTNLQVVDRKRLNVPPGVRPMRLRWHIIGTIAAMHAAALLACLPYFFSWTGVALVPIGLYVFGILGINVCYHRLLTHRGFVVPRWLEHGLVLLALCNLEGMPTSWVAAHRRHHQHADDEPDPHSPLVTFFWGHIGWLLVENPAVDRKEGMAKYCKDLLRDPWYKSMHERSAWALLYFVQLPVIWAIGVAVGWAWTGTAEGAVQLGWSWMVWGGLVRILVVWHVTWSVNSVAHMWGYQTYQTGEESRNNWLVALLSGGEGWHNNHHADQRSAAHGHRWWELDVTYLTIRGLRLLGLAREVVQPKSWGERKV